MGGVGPAGVPVTSAVEISDAFTPTPGVADAQVAELAPRIGGSLVTLTDDILLYAGGLAQSPIGAEPDASTAPLVSAAILVPVASSFVRLGADNALATGRFGHQALGLGDGNTVVFLGGVDVAPRRVPHPEAER